MTTIAYRSGIIAYDGRVTRGAVIVGGAVKAVVSKRHNCVFSGCGTTAALGIAFDRLERMTKLPWDDATWDPEWLIKSEDTEVIAIFPDGRIYWMDAGGYMQHEGPFYATGSGMEPALAAMHMGATALQAVRIACKIDVNSGPPIRTIDVRALVPTPKRVRKAK